MTLILYIIVVVVLIMLAMWAISMIPNLPPTGRTILNVLVLVAGIIAIGHQAGLF